MKKPSNPLELPQLYFIILGILYFSCASLAAANRHLWYDEFFSLYVANLPSLPDILKALVEGIDVNPPLDYFARHLSIFFLGNNVLAFRLPSLFIFWIGSYFLYRFVKTRIGSIPALATFCIPFSTIALWYAHEGRAYSLLFATSCISLYAWQKSVDSANAYRYRILLFLALTGGAYTHLYGVFNFIPVCAGEISRLLAKKKPDFSIIAVLFFSVIALCFLYPFIVNATAFSGHFWSKFNALSPFSFFGTLFQNIIYPTVSCIIFIGLYYALKSRFFIKEGNSNNTASTTAIPSYEYIAALTFCLIPFIEFIAAKFITHAMHPRYAIITINGIAILAGYLVYDLSIKDHRLSRIIFAGIFLSSIYQVVLLGIQYRSPTPAIDPEVESFIASAKHPVVMSYSHSYLYYHYYLPEESKQKIVMLMDKPLSIQYLGHDTDHIGLTRLNNIEPLNTATLDEFYQKHNEYYLVTADFNQGWLIRKIRDDLNKQLVTLDILIAKKDFLLFKASFPKSSLNN